jgi:iron complex transport system substrate-binding protein
MDAIMEQVGIPTVHIDASTDTMGEAYRMLGQLLGLEDEAEVLAQYCESVVNRTQEIVDQLGADGKTSLAYHAQVIDLLSDNAAVVDEPSSKGSGNPIDMEQLLIWNPEVIMFAPDSIYGTVGTDAAWQQLDAVKNGRYYEVPFGPYNWMGFPPSVNRYLGMIWMAQLLYPDVAGYDMYAEAAKFYDLFYHCKLTEAQYDELVANSLG